MRLFFDLDGTLIDATQRVYKLFQQLVPESDLDYRNYWEIKRMQTSHSDLLERRFAYDGISIASFQKAWHMQIEQPEWLTLDMVFDGVLDMLSVLNKEHALYLVTARQSKANTLAQLENLKLLPFFRKVLITEAAQEKYTLIADHVQTDSEDWMIGDTGKDIEVGKKLGMRTAAVLTGFRSRVSLEKYNPDVIVDSVTSLNKVWNK